MVMPGMSGRELAQHIREHQPDMKVLYISGYTDDMLLRAGALGPGMSFLQKPLKPDILASKLREILDKPSRQ
jgi:DNA-binding NtrC family response regulator